MKAIFFMLGVMLCVSGCGYHPVSGHMKTPLSVVLYSVENQTAYEHLTASLTTSLRRELRLKGVKLRAPGTPHTPRIAVRVFAVSVLSEAVRVADERELPVNRRWRMDVLVHIADDNGEMIWGPKVISVTSLSPVPGALSGELILSSFARKELVQQLAQKVTLATVEQLRAR